MAFYSYKAVCVDYNDLLEPYYEQFKNAVKKYGGEGYYSFDGDWNYDGDGWAVTAELIKDLLEWGGGKDSFKQWQKDNKIREKVFV